MRWVELSVEVHPEAIDAVAEVFRRHGTGGVAIEQPFAAHIEGEEEPVFTGLPVIKAYLPEDELAGERERLIREAFWHLKAFDLSPLGEVERKVIDEEDWASSWKENFYPVVAGRVVIKPTWREWEAQPGQIVVELDPGMAFGTGLHPTTRLMLQALQSRITAGSNVLDLGSGSGILAIAAALLGAEVTALDTSSVAVEVAADNVRANHLADRVTVGLGSIEVVAGRRFDLVLANIIAAVLVELAPDLAAALAPGAELLASGIIEERVEQVAAAFAAAGLEVAQRLNDEDWWLLVARRPA